LSIEKETTIVSFTEPKQRPKIRLKKITLQQQRAVRRILLVFLKNPSYKIWKGALRPSKQGYGTRLWICHRPHLNSDHLSIRLPISSGISEEPQPINNTYILEVLRIGAFRKIIFTSFTYQTFGRDIPFKLSYWKRFTMQNPLLYCIRVKCQESPKNSKPFQQKSSFNIFYLLLQPTTFNAFYRFGQA
jgi:hypothetical protein